MIETLEIRPDKVDHTAETSERTRGPVREKGALLASWIVHADEAFRPSLTVSILAYRSGDTSPDCLRSVLDATCDGDIEVIVREQGSDAAEYLALRRIADHASVPVEMERGPNLGFAGGHNRAFRRSSGALFLVLNADARLDESYLHEAVMPFADPQVGAVQGLVLREGSEPPVIDATGLRPYRSRRIVARAQGERYSSPLEPEEVWGADGAVALYRRRALDDVAHPDGEAFDETFFAYKEDVDLAWRLRRRGWSTSFAPAALAWHRRTARGTAAFDLRTFLAERRSVPLASYVRGFVNTRLMQIKNEQWCSFAPVLLPWLGREVAAWFLVIARRRGFGRIVIGLLRGLPRACRSRRWVQRRTLVNDDRRWFR